MTTVDASGVPVPSPIVFRTITGDLGSVELEAAFREWSHADNARRARNGLRIGAALMFVFAVADFAVLGATRTFAALTGARAVFALVGLWWATRVASDTPRILDRRLLIWTVSAATIVLASLTTRPIVFEPSVLTTAAVALAMYTLVPNRLPSAALGGVLLSVGYLLIIARGGTRHGADLPVIALAFVLVNTTGAAGNSWLARLARSEFLRLRAAEQAHAERLSFLAATSHEIRSPLHGIVACVDLLSGTDLTREQRNLLNLVRSCSDGMVGLLEEAVHQVRGDNAPPLIQLGVFDLHALVEEIAALVRARAAVRDVRVGLRIGDTVPRFVRADGGRLRQILLNLAENALAHGARERVDLFVDVSGPSGSDRQIQLELGVMDDGPGVDPAVRDAIFRPFVQAGTSTKTGRGMGLGLAICDRLARAMDGQIEVDDGPEGGARFRLRLSVQEATEAPRVATAAPLPPSQLNVLVVEDDAVNGHLMSLLLQRDGHAVTLVECAERAFEKIATQAFDVVLMDLRLPGMTGIEAIEQLRAQGASVPVIAMSAHIARADHDELLGAGCTAVLSKPMDLERLRAALARVSVASPGTAVAPREAQLVDAGLLAVHIEVLGEARVARLLELFVETSAPTVRALLDAAEKGDTGAVASLSHRIASAASSSALSACALAAAAVEDSARTGGAVSAEAVEHLRTTHASSAAAASVRAAVLKRAVA